jgi:glycerol-3-phosphate dehydrogenase (NAD(P)+)
MAEVAVLGAGMMGSALCVPLIDAGHEVRLVGTHLDREIVDRMRERSHHPKLNLDLPAAIHAYPLEELEPCMRGAELLVLGVSSAGVRWAAQQIAPYVRPDLPIVMISKGLEWDGEKLCTLPDVLRAALPETKRAAIHPVAVAGPCIAGELARRVETCVVFTGREPEMLAKARSFFAAPYYHVWLSDDVEGVETCAALKNAYAMGIALAVGLFHTRSGADPRSNTLPAVGSIALHNYEAAVFAQAVYEMRRVVTLVGGDPRSAAGLPGVGDLDVTCNGGRTGRFGRLLGLGIGPEQAIERMQGATLECLDILRVMRLASAASERRGELEPQALPLLAHLVQVALDGAAVDMPFHAFFGGSARGAGS